jgi:hypothetical protein
VSFHLSTIWSILNRICSPKRYLAIACVFQEKALKAYPPVDVCMGHLLVLIQYDWPRYHTLLKDIFARIIQKESFTYNLFFNYIISILATKGWQLCIDV